MSHEWAANMEKTGPLPPYSAIPPQYSQEQPVVVTQPTAVVMAYQPPPSTTKLPVYALFTSLLVTLVFVGFCCFIPGIFCLIPAVATAIHGIIKSESNKVADAKRLAVTSFILVLMFFCTYPFIVFTVVFSTSFSSPYRRAYH